MQNYDAKGKNLGRALCCALALVWLLPALGLAGGTTPPPGQPTDAIAYHGDTLSIEVLGAYYDGRALSMEWLVRNVTQGPLYLLLDTQTVNGIPLDADGQYNPDREMMPPGALTFGDITAALTTPDAGDTGAVALAYTVLRPIVPIIEMGTTEDTVAQVNARGDIALLLDGTFSFPDIKQPDASLSYAETLVEAGVMELAGRVELGFPLARSPLPRTALPGGQPLEVSLPGYTLRVNRADVSTYAGHIDLELVFADREAVERFAAYFPANGEQYADKYWDYQFRDENGAQEWHGLSRVNPMEYPVEQADGTWVLSRTFTFSEITSLPEEITITPYREDGSGLANRPPVPEEAVVLTFREAGE